MDKDDCDVYLQDMSSEDLKDLYKHTQMLDEQGRAFMKKYGNKDSYELNWKNPYLHIQILCKDILGKRALE